MATTFAQQKPIYLYCQRAVLYLRHVNNSSNLSLFFFQDCSHVNSITPSGTVLRRRVTRIEEDFNISETSILTGAQEPAEPSNIFEASFTVNNSDETPTKQVLHDSDNTPLSEAETTTTTTVAPTADSPEGDRPVDESLQQTTPLTNESKWIFHEHVAINVFLSQGYFCITITNKVNLAVSRFFGKV